ncbi:MAG: hypothetical protein WBG86_14490 [Polyangiales bacterium]
MRTNERRHYAPVHEDGSTLPIGYVQIKHAGRVGPVESPAKIMRDNASAEGDCKLSFHASETAAMLLARKDALEDALDALDLMYSAWDALMPNLKNGVVQDYALVLTDAPLAATEIMRECGRTPKVSGS